ALGRELVLEPRGNARDRLRGLRVVVQLVVRVVEEAVEATAERGVALGRRAGLEGRAGAVAEVVAQVDDERARARLVEGVLVDPGTGCRRDSGVDRPGVLGQVVHLVVPRRGRLGRVRVVLEVRARRGAGGVRLVRRHDEEVAARDT